MNDLERDKKIVEIIKGITQDLHEYNERQAKKHTMLLYNDKLFKDQDELYDYIEKDMLDHSDFMITKGNIEARILDKISEEAEEIEVEE